MCIGPQRLGPTVVGGSAIRLWPAEAAHSAAVAEAAALRHELAEIEGERARLRTELEQLRAQQESTPAQAEAEPEPEATVHEHLLFIPTPTCYRLLERAGAAPRP